MLANVLPRRPIASTKVIPTEIVPTKIVPRIVSTGVTAVAGYCLGSIPVAAAVARRHGVADLHAVGDGNPGYWNARNTIGAAAARPIFAGDVAKGAIAAAIGRATGGPWWMSSVGGGAAMLGHAFPITQRFRGGRSVLTFVGASLVAAPAASAAALATCGATWAATGRFDQAARIGVATFPLLQLTIDGPRRTAATGVLMSFIGLRFATFDRR